MIKLPDDIESLKTLVLEQDEQIRNYSDLLSYHIDRQVKAEAEVQRLNATAQPVSDGWIRCTDRLPDAEGKYLVYETLNNRVNHDYWMEPEPAEGFWNHYDMNVTHWMPLPAAPGGQDS